MKIEQTNRMVREVENPRDYCRFVIYDETEVEARPAYMKKVIEESFNHPHVGYITCYRSGEVEFETVNKIYNTKDIVAFVALFDKCKFE